ncbi:retrotransposon unclassified [Hordeum vulgare]|nr:retrotransposon unclassified [Hordeum vulgare]
MDQLADMDLDKLSRKRLMNSKAVTMQDVVEDIAVRDGIMLLTDKPSDAPDESSVAGCSKRAKLSPGATSSAPTGDRSMWKLIWKIAAPPKLRHFAWQVISGSLPSSAEMHRRHMTTQSTCLLCDRDVESSFHALLVCPHAATLWDAMQTVWPLPPRTDIKCTGKEWLFHFLLEVPESIHSRIIMVLWRIWYLRNEVVHGKTVPPLDISCSFLASYYNSYKNISLSVEDTVKGKTPVMELLPPTPAPVRVVKKWPAPDSNMVALSTDGSFNLEDGTAGSGMILRNCQGDVIFASYRKLFQCNDALESELQAIKEGLQLAFIHASSPVVLQSDSAMALNMIATAGYDRSLYGVLVVEIKNLLWNREVTLCKISREQNRVAHCLANFGRSGDSTACWLGRPPPCVTMLVAEDCKSVAV